ncbi:synaptotagmin-2 [Cynoglossus semilaevis]|uniref:synaptotagmin-2 n=1 Tax=Cynoglossus semilaevis TaxID=244447 RepID=UPI000496DDCD|nr:synaptotagmin-2-like [Cynoglossus semilaevis]
MIVVMESHSPLELLSAQLKILVSDTVKYTLLGLSVSLLLLALGILCWQTIRYCKQTKNNRGTRQTRVNSLLLYTDERPSMAVLYSRPPHTKVEDICLEGHRVNHYLSPSSDSSQTEGEVDEKVSIKKLEGSLRFSLYYDQMQSRLVVTILQVKRLQEHTESCSQQSFVKVRLMRAESHRLNLEDNWDKEEKGKILWTVLQEWKTQIIRSGSNPLLGDQFSCALQQQEDMLHHTNLRMEVWDFDTFSRNTILGEVRVQLGQLKISQPLELQEELQIPQKDLVGEVLLSLKFLPTSQRLEVGLLKVRTVPAETHSDTALYARISIQCNQYRLRYQKTSAVSRCLMTIFNEVFIFSLPEFPLERCKITVSVYETRKTNKHLIGQLTVGKEKSSEDKHWNLMMCSVRQPVAKWHGLMI